MPVSGFTTVSDDAHRLASQLLASDPFTSLTILTSYKRQRHAIIEELFDIGLHRLIARVFVVGGVDSSVCECPLSVCCDMPYMSIEHLFSPFFCLPKACLYNA